MHACLYTMLTNHISHISHTQNMIYGYGFYKTIYLFLIYKFLLLNYLCSHMGLSYTSYMDMIWWYCSNYNLTFCLIIW